MGRPGLKDAKTVTLSVKVSAEEAAQIDAARGTVPFSQWCRGLLLEALEPPRTERPEPLRKRGRAAVPPVAFKPPLGERSAPLDATGQPCAHPKARRSKGLCGSCGTYVGAA